MAVRKPGLGKGLDSLIPDHHSEKPLNNETGQADDKDGVLMVKLSKV